MFNVRIEHSAVNADALLQLKDKLQHQKQFIAAIALKSKASLCPSHCDLRKPV